MSVYKKNNYRPGRQTKKEREQEEPTKELTSEQLSHESTTAEVFQTLDEKAGTKYKSNSKNTTKHIKARLNDGYTLEDFKSVIDKKCSEWLNTDMEKYLCPDTLFGSKFEKYLNQKINGPGVNKNTQNNAAQDSASIDLKKFFFINFTSSKVI